MDLFFLALPATRLLMDYTIANSSICDSKGALADVIIFFPTIVYAYRGCDGHTI